jgi:hypothetical protein
MNWSSALVLSLSISLLSAGEMQFNLNRTKASDLGNKTFDAKSMSSSVYDPTGTKVSLPQLELPASSMAKPVNFSSVMITPPTVSYDKTFATKSADLPGPSEYPTFSQQVFPLGTSAYALLSPPRDANKVVTVKDYTGPEAEKIHRDLKKIEDGLAGLKALPDRTLSIEEVKQMLNRDMKPALQQTAQNEGSGQITPEQLQRNAAPAQP